MIRSVGVVGGGTMGSALVQKFSQEGFKVTLVDREIQYVERGLLTMRMMWDDGIKAKIFTPEQVDTFNRRITGSDRLESLASCDLVVEAVFEDLEVKKTLFKRLSGIVSSNTILATNTSSFSVTELAEVVKDPSRFIGLHYFYHAAKNRLVEIVPGALTSDETIQLVTRFSVLAGKDPIRTLDVHGFAVNRFFVPWLNEAVRLLEEGAGSIDEIDQVCREVFGINMGPFALMNATGVSIALHAQRTLERFGPAYRVAAMLEAQVAKGERWNCNSAEITVEPLKADRIKDRMLGCAFYISAQVLNEGVCTATDLNQGARIGLRWKQGPVDLMLKAGFAEVIEKVERFAGRYGATTPRISLSQWTPEYVTLEVNPPRAVVRMNRPEELNALNELVIRQLFARFREAESHSGVKTIFLTGSGKAFVAGADVRYFVKHIRSGTLDRIVDFTSYGQKVFTAIDRSKKKVVALLNGLAMGGGLELALCADQILAVPQATLSFPETSIGIYPGLGGTQRTSSRLGKGLAKYLVLTGKTLRANEAAGIGLIDGIVSKEQLMDIQEGVLPVPEPTSRQAEGKWKVIADLFSSVPYSELLKLNQPPMGLMEDEFSKIAHALKSKAPVALRIADALIEEARGPQSELEQLTTVFSTKDALNGLSSIGKKVEFEGK